MSGRGRAGPLACVPVRLEPARDRGRGGKPPGRVALGDGDLRVRKSSVTDKIKARSLVRGNERSVTVWWLTDRVAVVWSYGWTVPVEFLSDQEAAAFGRYGGSVSQADLERFFYLDDADRKLVAGQREDHNRLGFSVQLATVRYIGRFLADPLEGVPAEVIDFLAGQLQIADPSCVKRYAQRQQTHREHAAKIRETLGLKDFAEVEAELAEFAGRRAWVTGDGPKAIFDDAVGWLRDRDVLLPGVSRLARLVARERDAATQRLWETLHAALTGPQRLALDALLAVPPGSRVSELERWRTGPARASGPQMVRALNRVAEIIGSGLSRVRLDASVTPRRLAELARYGMGTDAAHLKRHGDQRRLATLVATVTQLEATATDDALELLELLMATELAGELPCSLAPHPRRRSSPHSPARRCPATSRAAGAGPMPGSR